MPFRRERDSKGRPIQIPSCCFTGDEMRAWGEVTCPGPMAEAVSSSHCLSMQGTSLLEAKPAQAENCSVNWLSRCWLLSCRLGGCRRVSPPGIGGALALGRRPLLLQASCSPWAPHTGWLGTHLSPETQEFQLVGQPCDQPLLPSSS